MDHGKFLKDFLDSGPPMSIVSRIEYECCAEADAFLRENDEQFASLVGNKQDTIAIAHRSMIRVLVGR